MDLKMLILVGGFVSTGVFWANPFAGLACLLIMQGQGFDADYFAIDVLVFLVAAFFMNIREHDHVPG